MFRDDHQRARVCKALCNQLFVKGLFTEEGPTERAIDLLEEGGGTLSSGEQVLFRAAWDLWSSEGQLPFAGLLRLDDPKLLALGSLLVALAQGGGDPDDPTPRARDFEPIEAWLRRWSR